MTKMQGYEVEILMNTSMNC